MHSLVPLALAALAGLGAARARLPRAPAAAPRAPGGASCEGCHDSLGARGPAPHQAYFAGRCATCHVPGGPRGKCTGSPKGWALAPGGARQCEECHEDARAVRPGETLHTAVKRGECNACHDPHGRGKPHLLAADPPELCLRCHEVRAPGNARAAARLDMQAPSIHGALTNGCKGCHAPGHSGKNPKLLLSSSTEALCYECHERKDKLPEVHAALQTEGCLGCHVPHTSKSARLLTAPTAAALCLNCHPRIDERPTAHPPVAQHQCTACHEPHSSSEEPLLRADNKKLCRTCHAKVGAVARRHQPVMRRGCESCHLAHGEGAKLLRRPVNALCQRCHSRILDGAHVKAGPKVHPISGVPDPRRKGQDLSCVSCHDPHGGAHPKFLSSEDPAASCAACHKT